MQCFPKAIIQKEMDRGSFLKCGLVSGHLVNRVKALLKILISKILIQQQKDFTCQQANNRSKVCNSSDAIYILKREVEVFTINIF